MSNGALEALKAIENALCNTAQIINVVKQEWLAEGAWSEWDEETRESITNCRYYDIDIIRATLTRQSDEVVVKRSDFNNVMNCLEMGLSTGSVVLKETMIRTIISILEKSLKGEGS